MPIDLTCSCGKRLRVGEEYAGRQGQCPSCGGLLEIPAASVVLPVSSPSPREAPVTTRMSEPMRSGLTLMKQQSSEKSPLGYILWSIIGGVAVFAAGLAVCGLTGVGKMEYPGGPGAQAFMLALGGSCYGVIPGFIVGLLIVWWKGHKPP